MDSDGTTRDDSRPTVSSHTPEVSVVMSVYRDRDTLPATLESIASQRDVDFEVIVVDDGSVDGSGDIVRERASTDARFRVLRQENTGLTRALIAGCSAARAPFIARHDGGDVCTADRLSSQLSLMRSDDTLAFVSCWTQYVGPRDEPLYVVRCDSSSPTRILDPSRVSGVIDGPSHHGSVMFRKTMYDHAGGYRSEFYFGQDWDLWYRLAERGTFAAVQRVLYCARVTPDSLSGLHKPAQERFAAISRAALAERLQTGSDVAALARCAEVRSAGPGRHTSSGAGAYFIGEALRRRGDVRCQEYFRDAIAADPFHWRARLRIVQSWFLRPARGVK